MQSTIPSGGDDTNATIRMPNGSSGRPFSPGQSPAGDVEVGNQRSVPALSKGRLLAAFLVAFAADSIGILPGEVFPIVFDLFVGLVLTVILGPWVAVFGALILEAIPGVGMLPSWIAAVAWVAYSQRSRPTS